jgi:hypothetical protein
MELWVGNAKRVAICHYCSGFIAKDSPMLQGRVKKRKGRPWPPIIRWHLDCWYESSKEFLAGLPQGRVVNPATSLGRPKTTNPSTGNALSDDDRKARRKIVSRFNVLMFRRNQLINGMAKTACVEPREMERARSLTAMMWGCVKEITRYGPVPPKWSQVLSIERTGEPISVATPEGQDDPE